MLPNVSTEDNFLIRTFLLIILLVPNANEIVTTAGSPSGTAATARLIAINSISAVFCLSINPVINTIIAIIITKEPRVFPTLSSFFCKGVCFSLWL